MREPEQREIDGVVYRVTPLPAGKGLKVMQRIAKVLGPVLTSGATAGAGSVEDAVVRELGAVAGRLSDDDLEFVSRALAESTTFANGHGAQVQLGQCFDLHFAGEYERLLPWMAFALGVNFAPFFKRLGARLGRAGGSAGAAGAPSDSNSPPASSGASTG
jgi:hypothetical protein